MKTQDFNFAGTTEVGFIGALLIRPDRMGDVVKDVDPSDIYTPTVSTIYEAMVQLWNSGTLPTINATTDLLHQQGKLDHLGGAVTLLEFQGGAPHTNVRSFAELVISAATRRRLILAAQAIKAEAADPNVTVEDAITHARESLTGINLATSVPSEVIDVETFCEGEDEFDWLVPGLVERGDRVLVVAAEASGKTMMLHQIAVTCAFGIHPFAHGTRITALRVLRLDFENPPSLVRRKIRPMLHQGQRVSPYGDPQMMGVVCRPGGIDVTNRADVSWLAAQIADFRPDLVVAGPLYKMFVADDKWEQGARTTTSVLDDLRTRMDFSLILETHAPQEFGGKRNLRPIGSSLWMRWPEFGVSFAPMRDHPNVVELTQWKARDERSWPRFLARGGAWPWSRSANPETGERLLPDSTPPYEQEEVF